MTTDHQKQLNAAAVARYRSSDKGKATRSKRDLERRVTDPEYREKRNESSSSWYRQNKERHAENMRQWRTDNAYELKAKKAVYYQENVAGQYDKAQKRNQYLLRTYGIDLDGYQELLDRQGGSCAVCGRKPESSGKYDGRGDVLHVDHDHATGKVRGLLCQQCNVSIGLLGESADRAMGLAAYIIQNESVLVTVSDERL